MLVVAAATFRRRPLPNSLIVAGVLVAAVGSALAGTGVAATSAFVAVSAVLLYLGVAGPPRTRPRWPAGATVAAGAATVPSAPQTESSRSKNER